MRDAFAGEPAETDTPDATVGLPSPSVPGSPRLVTPQPKVPVVPRLSPTPVDRPVSWFNLHIYIYNKYAFQSFKWYHYL